MKHLFGSLNHASLFYQIEFEQSLAAGIGKLVLTDSSSHAERIRLAKEQFLWGSAEAKAVDDESEPVANPCNSEARVVLLNMETILPMSGVDDQHIVLKLQDEDASTAAIKTLEMELSRAEEIEIYQLAGDSKYKKIDIN